MNEKIMPDPHGKKITIVFVIDFLADRAGIIGGTERQLVEVVNRLDTRKFRPILVCLQEFCQVPIWDSIRCEKKILHVYSLASRKGLYSLLSFSYFLRKNNVDILQTFFFDSTCFGVVAARLAMVKYVLSCRRDLGFWQDLSMIKKLRLCNLLTTKILVNSYAIKEQVVTIEKIKRNSVDVVYNGIDIEAIDSCSPLSKIPWDNQEGKSFPVVGIVANFNRQVKRVDVFIKAAAEVITQFTDVRFVIVGGGNLENELKQLVDRLGLSNHVVFTGKQPDAIAYIKTFDVGVLTSDSEGFPNAALEYMAAGIAAVATDVGGTGELVLDGITGFLAPKGNFNTIAHKICILLADDTLRLRMGRAGQRYVEKKFGWMQKIKELEHYYQHLLKT